MADEVIDSGSSVDSGTGGASLPESNVQDSGAQDAPVDGSQGGEQNAPADEGGQGDEFVKGEDGQEYIPRKAFEARLAKLTAQKNEGQTARELLESIKNDPVVRKEFMESLNIGESRTNSSEESNEPTPFEKFLAPLPQEHQAHYRNMGQAFADEFKPFVESYVKEQLGPIMGWIGQEKLRNFSQTNKDFGKYERDVAKIMQEGRARSVEDAYKLASFEDKMKSVFNAGQKGESERRNKIASVPSSGRNSGGVTVKGNKPMSLRDALNKAGQELGYTG